MSGGILERELERQQHAACLISKLDASPSMVLGQALTEARDAERRSDNSAGRSATECSPSIGVEDFRAYMPTHQYIFVPSRELWPASSVNARVPPIQIGDRWVAASKWLDEHQAVEQMTWAPGLPLLIRDRLISQGGWIERLGVSCFNLYRPAQIRQGDASKAGPWLDHLSRIYPDEASHIASWFAHRVQRPGEKVNHALVLGGAQGIGKDTLLEPLKHAIGAWNFAEVQPAHLLGRFNGFVKSVVLRINEARDLGDVDRYAFYDHMKVYTASPPDVLRCDEKNLREYYVPNVTGVVITSNHKTDGIYVPADDRRHFIAWSPATKETFAPEYWTAIYRWYRDGGLHHVAAYLATYDLSTFDAKAPPPKTAAFFDVVDANRAPEDADLADVLEACRHPKAMTLSMLIDAAKQENRGAFAEWLADHRNRRKIPHRLESAGYAVTRNDAAKDGLWKLSGRRQVIYARASLSVRDRIAAAKVLAESKRWG